MVKKNALQQLLASEKPPTMEDLGNNAVQLAERLHLSPAKAAPPSTRGP